MSSSAEKSSSSQFPMTTQAIVYTGIIWSGLALLFFLWFSISVPGEERPLWYSIGTYIFELGAFLGAAILCFRNWRSPQIVSGRNVWLGIGLGMLSYFLGTVLFGYWELVLKQEPIVSPGDLFYILTYVALGWGMVLAVTSRKLNLEIWQWVITVVIGIAGIAFAVWLYVSAPADECNSAAILSPTNDQAVLVASANPTNIAQLAQVKTAPKTAPKPAKAIVDPCQPETTATGWVKAVEDVLAPLETPVNLLYVVADIFLLIIATTLLLAFWGGRFSKSWILIAAAAFSFYISDMWFKYATDHIPDYQSGFLLEVFWVFSGVLFAVGAALEYDTSSRSSSRRGGRKRA